MSKMNKKNVLALWDTQSFSGIDTRASGDGEGKIKSMVNFRILSDGSIEKRNGFRFAGSIGKKIRAVKIAEGEGNIFGYAVAENRVFKLNFDSNGMLSQYSDIGSIGTSEGRVSVFFYRGTCYISDSTDIYSIIGNSVISCEGYVPLYGKDWPTDYAGEINEPLNMLTRRARISYVATDPPTIFLPTLHEVESVQAVYRNDVLVPSHEYEIDNNFRTVNIAGLNAGDRILMYLTYKEQMARTNEFNEVTEAITFGGINDSRVFMWKENGNRLFCSSYVSEESLQSSQAVYGQSGALYFPSKCMFAVGDGTRAIKGAGRHYGRLLIFTDGETWMADAQYGGLEELPLMRINSANGAASPDGVTKCGNEPISVDSGRILRWRSNTDELDDCNSYSISDEILPYLSDEFFKKALAFEDKYHGEILFALPEDSDGRIYVYEEKKGNWYFFDGIKVNGFFDAKKNVGFFSGTSLYIFDDDLENDMVDAQSLKSIAAELVTHPIDFGLPHRTKRISRVRAVAESNGQAIDVRLLSDNAVNCTATVGTDGTDLVRSYETRIVSDRFVRTALYVKSGSSKNVRIYRLSVAVKK